MYNILLFFHSFLRWLVLASLLFATYKAYSGWLNKKPFTEADNITRLAATIISQVQLVLGITLYFISPIVNYFLNNYKEAVKVRDIRFFGMEHSLMMFVAVILITIGSMSAKRKTSDVGKFKTMAIWFSVAVLLILVNIPWPFNPFGAHRPYFRY